MTTLFDEPVIIADNRNPRELRSLPPTHGQFVLMGHLLSALKVGGIFAVVAEIESENRRTGATFWSFGQYERFFAAAATPQAKWEPILLPIIAVKARYRAAREAGLSAWQFAESERRHREADADAEARRDAINAAAIEKSKATAYAKRVAELEIEARARRDARENVERERPRSGRVARSHRYTPAEPEQREYIAPTGALVAVGADAEPEQEYLPPDDLF